MIHRLVIQHPGANSCIWTVWRFMLDNNITTEQARLITWYIFLINMPDDYDLAHEVKALRAQGFKYFWLINEEGVFCEPSD